MTACSLVFAEAEEDDGGRDEVMVDTTTEWSGLNGKTPFENDKYVFVLSAPPRNTSHDLACSRPQSQFIDMMWISGLHD